MRNYFYFFFAVSPRCKPGTEQMSVGALNMHSMQVKCEVDADPADHVKFAWTYNNTRNVSPVSIKTFEHKKIVDYKITLTHSV